MGHRLLGFGIALIMDYMDHRYKSCDYDRFFWVQDHNFKETKSII